MDKKISEGQELEPSGQTKTGLANATPEMRFSRAQFTPGSLVSERYKILSVIASGGGGTVYKVEQVFLGRQFALKTLNSNLVSEVALIRFQKEAQSTNRLQHENIVKTIDFGMIEDNQPFLVMELIEGTNLALYIKEKGVLSVADSLHLLLPVCSALSYAHREGVVHRDIKPGNILLTVSPDNSQKLWPKLADFGIAKIALPEEVEALTKTGEVFGTPLYMSPEQCAGINVDNRSDIYALGCVLYECLTGAPPFHGRTAVETITQQLSTKPLSLREASLGREFPQSLEVVVSKMLAKDPKQRYQNCGELSSDLQKVLAGRASDQPSKEALSSSQPGSAKKRWTILALIIVAVLIWGTVFKYLSARRSALEHEATSPAPSVGDGSKKQEGLDKVSVDILPDDAMHDSGSYSKQKQVVWTEGVGEQKVRHFDFGKTNYGHMDWILPNGSVSSSIPATGYVQIPANARVRFDLGQKLICSEQGLIAKLKDAMPVKLTLKINDGAAFLGDVEDTAYDGALFYVSQLKSLEELYMSGAPVTSEGLTEQLHIENLPKLSSLTISRTLVDGEKLEHLPEKFWCQLRYLDINQVKNGRRILKFLKNSKNISSLYLEHLNLSDDDMDILARMPSLSALHLRDNPKIDNHALDKLAASLSLRYLNLQGTSVDAGALPRLKRMLGLRDIVLPAEHWTPSDLSELQQSWPGRKIVREFQNRRATSR